MDTRDHRDALTLTPKPGRKTIHIHIGPHETGTAQIADVFASNKPDLLGKCGVTPVKGRFIRHLAKGLKQNNADNIKAALVDLATKIGDQPSDVVLSAPELAGQMPGRPGNRHIYPDMARNLSQIRDGLPNFDVRFYFFTRDRDQWLRSIYVSLLCKQSRFSSFDGFLTFLNLTPEIWDDVLAPARDALATDLIEIPFPEENSFSPALALFQAIAPEGAADLPPFQVDIGTFFAPQTIKILEEINSNGASLYAKDRAKMAVLKGTVDPSSTSASANVDRIVTPEKPEWLAPELEALWSRAKGRIEAQTQANLMPAIDCELSAYRGRIVQAPDEFPKGGRQKMENQVLKLAYRFRGKPEIAFLLGLTISYLRRNTEHTDHAARLFQRLWAEEHAILLGVLPARWLISSFQTFMDYGCNEMQRRIGAAAYFMTNTLKLYETERALEGLPPDATYPSQKPTTRSGFPGLDRFPVGGTDLMLNTNALLVELAAQDAVAGRVLQEFLLRLKRYNSAFSRMDRSRVALGVENPQFANCWSFFEPPD